MMDTDADGQREVLAFTPNAEIFPLVPTDFLPSWRPVTVHRYIGSYPSTGPFTGSAT